MNHQRIVVSRHGGPEVLELHTEEIPEPQAGEVRVRVVASGVSFGDVLGRIGSNPDSPKPPFTPGYDVVGTVDALGPGVTSPAAGTTVVALLADSGGYTEHICLPADRVVPVPDGVDPIDASAAAINYFAAHQMLHRVAGVKPGRRILVHGAAGGLGSALLASVEAYGTASRHKHDVVSALGATPIDYRAEDVLARVRAAGGADAAFDAIGGTSFLRSYRALRPGGHLVAYGVSRAAKDGKRNLPLSVASFLGVKLLGLLPRRRATFYTTGSRDELGPGSYRDDLATVLDLLARGAIRPVVAERMPLTDVARAHELLERGAVSGKIVLTTERSAA